MSDDAWTETGAVVSLWRYPVKSMMGEVLNTAQVLEHGLSGDRVYGLLDRSDGKVATAKNPRKWPTLFAFRAAFIEPSGSSSAAASLRITLPDGRVVTGEQSDLNQVLSKALNREVTLAEAERGQVAGVQSSVPAGWTGEAEEYWPDIEGLDHRDTVTDFAASIRQGGSRFRDFVPTSWWNLWALSRGSWKAPGSVAQWPSGRRFA